MDVFTSASRYRQGVGTGSFFPGKFFCSGRPAGGFTLIEIMVTVAVVAIVSLVVLSSLRPVLAENRIVLRVNMLTGLLQMARSEAVRRGVDVVICHSRDGRYCDRRDDWSENWLVFVDINRDRRRDANECIVAFQQAPGNGTRADYRAFGSRHYLTYRPDGRTRTNGTFTVCHPEFPALSRAVIVTKSGRPRISRAGPDGRRLACP